MAGAWREWHRIRAWRHLWKAERLQRAAAKSPHRETIRQQAMAHADQAYHHKSRAEQWGREFKKRGGK